MICSYPVDILLVTAFVAALLAGRSTCPSEGGFSPFQTPVIPPEPEGPEDR